MTCNNLLHKLNLDDLPSDKRDSLSRCVFRASYANPAIDIPGGKRHAIVSQGDSDIGYIYLSDHNPAGVTFKENARYVFFSLPQGRYLVAGPYFPHAVNSDAIKTKFNNAKK